MGRAGRDRGRSVPSRQGRRRRSGPASLPRPRGTGPAVPVRRSRSDCHAVAIRLDSRDPPIRAGSNSGGRHALAGAHRIVTGGPGRLASVLAATSCEESPIAHGADPAPGRAHRLLGRTDPLAAGPLRGREHGAQLERDARPARGLDPGRVARLSRERRWRQPRAPGQPGRRRQPARRRRDRRRRPLQRAPRRPHRRRPADPRPAPACAGQRQHGRRGVGLVEHPAPARGPAHRAGGPGRALRPARCGRGRLAGPGGWRRERRRRQDPGGGLAGRPERRRRGLRGPGRQQPLGAPGQRPQRRALPAPLGGWPRARRRPRARPPLLRPRAQRWRPRRRPAPPARRDRGRCPPAQPLGSPRAPPTPTAPARARCCCSVPSTVGS